MRFIIIAVTLVLIQAVQAEVDERTAVSKIRTAIYHGKIQEVISLFEKDGLSPTAKFKSSPFSPLHAVTAVSRFEEGIIPQIVSYLISKGVDVSEEPEAVYNAARNGHIGALTIFLEAGRDLAKTNARGQSAYGQALIQAMDVRQYERELVRNKIDKIVKLLLHRRWLEEYFTKLKPDEIARIVIRSTDEEFDQIKELANPDSSAAHIVIGLLRGIRDEDQIRTILKRLKALSPINQTDSNGYTMLMVASHDGSLNVVRGLVSLGADLTIKSRDGRSALDIAIQTGHKEIADFIKSKGLTKSRGIVGPPPDGVVQFPGLENDMLLPQLFYYELKSFSTELITDKGVFLNSFIIILDPKITIGRFNSLLKKYDLKVYGMSKNSRGISVYSMTIKSATDSANFMKSFRKEPGIENVAQDVGVSIAN